MAVLNEDEKNILLRIARTAIETELLPSTQTVKPPMDPPELQKERGCFVTLHLKGALRGCIGTIEPTKPLKVCVEENALNAAFCDPRFPRLQPHELEEINIEISVLSLPHEITFKNPDELKRQLKPGVHGVIVSRDFQSATFLPQVWDQLPEKEAFLGNLCQKAGMEALAWKSSRISVKLYEVEHFAEPD